MPEIVIYTRQLCGYCTAAKRLLDRKGVRYIEHDATGRPEVRAEMIRRSNGRMTFPQIFIGDLHVGGCDDLFNLEEARQLEPLLAA